MSHEVLQKLYDGEITAQKAYESFQAPLNRKALKRAHYVKMRIHLPNESVWLNMFLRLLFMFPFPIFIARFFLNFAANKAPKDKTGDVDLKEIITLLKYAGRTTISVQNDDADIKIKIR